VLKSQNHPTMSSIVPLPGQVDERNPTPCPLPAALSPPSASRLTAQDASGSPVGHSPEPPEVLLHRAAQSMNLLELNRVLSKPRLNVNAAQVRCLHPHAWHRYSKPDLSNS
jgi:hypothetical protein